MLKRLLDDSDVGKKFVLRSGLVTTLRKIPGRSLENRFPFGIEEDSLTFTREGIWSYNSKQTQNDIVDELSPSSTDAVARLNPPLTDADLGGRFRRRDGAVVVLERNKPDSIYFCTHPYRVSYSGHSYTLDGMYSTTGDQDPVDLVERLGPKQSLPSLRDVFFALGYLQAAIRDNDLREQLNTIDDYLTAHCGEK